MVEHFDNSPIATDIELGYPAKSDMDKLSDWNERLSRRSFFFQYAVNLLLVISMALTAAALAIFVKEVFNINIPYHSLRL